jgi:hypothetical protein
MGLFYEKPTLTFNERLRPHMTRALEFQLDQNRRNLDETVQQLTNAAADDLLGGAEFRTGRFLVALLIFAALVVGGIITDVTGHSGSSTALYGFAGTVFGIVAAFLGAEKNSTG